MLTNQNKGIYLAIITALVSGIAIFVNKFAVEAIKPPLVFVATKNTGVGLLILGALLISGKWQQVKKVTKRELVYLALIGIIGGALPFYLFFTGLSQIPAINAALIHKTLVVWVTILAIPLLKEKLSRLQVFAVLLLFSSNLILGGFEGFQFSWGELFVLVATILWAIENILAKKVLPTIDPDLVTAARMGFGSIILLAATLFTAPTGLGKILALSPNQWFWMILTTTTLLVYVMSWYRALKLAPAITVTSILVASTLITNLLSAIFITQVWTITMALQAGLILFGLGLFWWSAKNETITKEFLSTSFVQKVKFSSSAVLKILTTCLQ